MRTRLLAAVTLVIAFGLVGGAYAYDRSKRDRIAPGVEVNGVPIGGLTRARAEARLREALLAPLARPVTARFHGRAFTLAPRDAAVAVDIRATVADALGRSRAGGILSRSWRNLRGATLQARLAAQVSFSRPAIDALVARVRGAIDRPPREAKVDLLTGKVAPTRSRTGRRVRYRTLARDLQRTLLSPAARAPVAIKAAITQPKVTTAALAKRYPAVLIVDRAKFKLTLYRHLERAKTYRIAVGQVGLETPAGLYAVQNKAINPAWHVPDSPWAGTLAGQVIAGDDPSNPIKARWLGIYDGAGIHGTSEDASIGSAASHGCIRMHIPDVEELYDQVPVGAPVYIL